MTDRYTDDTAWQEVAGYSRGVRRGDVIAISGTTASAPDGSAVHPGDTYRQAVVCLERVVAAVEALGGKVADVLETVVYLAPDADWQGAARAHKEVFTQVRPANTTLHVASLVGDGLLVEISARAIVDTS